VIAPLSTIRRLVASALFAGATLAYWAMIPGILGLSAEQHQVLALLAGLDAIAIVALWVRPGSQRVRTAVAWYALLRFGLAVTMFNLPSAILYGFAGLLVATAPRHRVRGSSTARHEFTAASGGWLGAMTPLNASRSWAGALASGQRGCALCGRGQEDPLHWKAEA